MHRYGFELKSDAEEGEGEEEGEAERATGEEVEGKLAVIAEGVAAGDGKEAGEEAAAAAETGGEGSGRGEAAAGVKCRARSRRATASMTNMLECDSSVKESGSG